MTLLGLQQEFSWHAGRLLLRVAETGLACTLGDAHRSVEEQRRLMQMGLSQISRPEVGAHVRKLALDLNLFSMGHYIRDDRGHRELAAWWRMQHPSARWGGEWGDYNHYSFEYGGVR